MVVTFRYTDVPHLKPYYLTFASKLKKLHPDIILEKISMPLVDKTSNPIFEVLVDGKAIMGGGRTQQGNAGRIEVAKTQSIYVSIPQVSAAIAKARRKKRPDTLYGGIVDEEERLSEGLRSDVLNIQFDILKKKPDHWSD